MNRSDRRALKKAARAKPAPRRQSKPVYPNPVAYVVEGLKPITEHDSYWLDLRIKNSAAMSALFKGQATRQDMETLIAMHNICEALWQMGVGRDYGDVVIRGKVALLDVGARGKSSGHFVLKAPEMQALNDLMELHDAQMEISTVRDLEKATAIARQQINNKQAYVIKDGKTSLNTQH